MRYSLIRAVRRFYEDALTDRLRDLISDATSDLYTGHVEDDDYPGFERACREIRATLPCDDLWVSIDDEILGTEPHWAGEDEYTGEGEYPGAWSLLDRAHVREILVGKELSKYI